MGKRIIHKELQILILKLMIINNNYIDFHDLLYILYYMIVYYI